MSTKNLHLYPTANYHVLGDAAKHRRKAEGWEKLKREVRLQIVTEGGRAFRGTLNGAGGLMLGLRTNGTDIGIGYMAIALMEEIT